MESYLIYGRDRYRPDLDSNPNYFLARCIHQLKEMNNGSLYFFIGCVSMFRFKYIFIVGNRS